MFFFVHEMTLKIHERNIRVRFVKFRGCFICPRNNTKDSRKKYSCKIREISWMFYLVSIKTKKALRLKCFFRGGGWTRTTELIRGQIYSLLQLPLCDSPNLSLRTCLKKTMQRYDLFLNFQQKNELF